MSSRRDFLKKATLAAAGAALTTTGVKAIEKFTMPSVNINRKGKGDGRLHLRFFPYELKLRHVFTVATYSRTTTPDVQVELTYEGITGYGEASMPQYLGQTVESVTKFLRNVNVEQFTDPFRIEDILGYVDSLSPNDSAAKAAIDIALHDLVGKLLGAPWYKIWGLTASKAPSTTFTIGRDNDKEMIETIRSVTDLPIAVDVNQGWTDKQKALDMIFWLKEKGIVMVEQPMPKNMLDETAWVTERSPLPIFADEAIQRLKDIKSIEKAYSGINIKLMKCTGMREAWKMLNYARARGLKVMIGCMTETSCAVSAAAQLAPAVDFADLDGNLLISNDRFNGMQVVKGKITLPDSPGIGVTLK